MAAFVQSVAGITPPELSEARVREAYPSVARSGGIASLGRAFTATIILAPLAWIIMSFAYFVKLMPFAMRRYTLTNRRVMIRAGWKGTPAGEVALADIDEVKMVVDGNSDFFRAGNLEIISQGKTVLTLTGIPEPEGFRHAILNTRNAWAPGKSKTLPFIPASAVS
ncbi:MAG: PH domain-containing protein [Gemmataceae bacterium]|nr:PH domain-containing protein [Gemmataceae bacterium]